MHLSLFHMVATTKSGELEDTDGSLVEEGWKLVPINGDKITTEDMFVGVDDVLETVNTVTHSFLNDRIKVPLTIEKEVTGNQGSRDKYFKFKIEIANAGERTLHLDMSDATTSFETGADGTKVPNGATIYTRNVILSGSGNEGGNTRDDDANLTYGNATDDQKRTCEWTWVDDNETPGDDSDDVTYRSQWDNEEGWVTYAGDSTTPLAEGKEPIDVATRTFAHGQHIKTGTDGKATIYVYLQHGESVTIRDLPFGASYEITETNENYYPITDFTGPIEHNEILDVDELTADMTTGEWWTSDYTSTDGGYDIPFGDNSNMVGDNFFQHATEITFTNRSEGTVPTEVRLNPWIGLMGPLMLILLYAHFYMRRRRRNFVYAEGYGTGSRAAAGLYADDMEAEAFYNAQYFRAAKETSEDILNADEFYFVEFAPDDVDEIADAAEDFSVGDDFEIEEWT